MNGNIADSAAPADNNLIRSRQVSPLPVGPGGNNPIKNQLNDTNTKLTMLTAQANANTKYDPATPKPITKQVIKEAFTNEQLPLMLFVVGGLLIVYGLVAK
jgi:hypothetical protein